MEQILEGLTHGETPVDLHEAQGQYLADSTLDPLRMNKAAELADSLLASTGQQLARTIRSRLLNSTYGRYYFVDGSADSFRRWDSFEEEDLGDLAQSCREDGLIEGKFDVRPPRGSEGTIWACQLAESLWPTDLGQLRLGLAYQAHGQKTSALASFHQVAQDAVVPSTQIIALLLATNLKLHHKNFSEAIKPARLAIQLAPQSSAATTTSLLAGIQAHDLPLIREAAYRLDELGERASTTLDLFAEQRARRVRDGLQETPRKLPKSSRLGFGENALRVYHLNYPSHA